MDSFPLLLAMEPSLFTGTSAGKKPELAAPDTRVQTDMNVLALCGALHATFNSEGRLCFKSVGLKQLKPSVKPTMDDESMGHSLNKTTLSRINEGAYTFEAVIRHVSNWRKLHGGDVSKMDSTLFKVRFQLLGAISVEVCWKLEGSTLHVWGGKALAWHLALAAGMEWMETVRESEEFQCLT